MNKKIMVTIFFILFSVSLSGCNKTDELEKKQEQNTEISYGDEYVVGQDSSYMFQLDNNWSMITKAEDGYYFRLDGAMFFADKELNTILPACTVSNCKHMEEDKCEAYMGIGALLSTIQYYNGKIYTDSKIDLSTLERFLDSDGRNYANIFEISDDARIKRNLNSVKLNSIAPIIHRGYAYCFYTEPVEKEVNGKTITAKYGVVSRVNLENGEEDRFLDYTNIKISDKDWIQDIFAYGNYVYYITYPGEIYIYSLKDKTFEKVENLRNIKFWFMDGKIIYKHNSGEPEEKRKVYIANLDFSEPEYIFSLENERYDIGSDGKYIYVDNRFPAHSNKTDRILYYYDKNTYELLGEIKLEAGIGIERYGFGDEDYYFYVDYPENCSRLMCVVKDSLATGNVEKKVLLEWEKQ